jgi:hypothetical protein
MISHPHEYRNLTAEGPMVLYLIDVWFPRLKKAEFKLFLNGDDPSADDGYWNVSNPGGFHFGQPLGYWTVNDHGDGKLFIEFMKRKPVSVASNVFWGREPVIPEMIATISSVQMKMKFPLPLGLAGYGTLWGQSHHENDKFQWKVVGRFI